MPSYSAQTSSLRGAALRDHAGLGRTEQFDDLRRVTLLGLAREFDGERRRRGDDRRERRQRDARVEQRAQVKRRRYQHAARGQLGERGGDFGREQRLRRVNRRARAQRQEYRQLETVHVLRRDGRENLRRIDDRGERRGVERAARAYAAPGFHVGFRRAGRPGREADRDDMVGGNRQVAEKCVAAAADRIGHMHVAQMRRQRRRRVAERVGVGVGVQHVVDRLRRPGDGQKVGLAGDDGRAERDQEVVALLAQVQRIARLGQTLREGEHVGEKLARADFAAIAPGECAREVLCCE